MLHDSRFVIARYIQPLLPSAILTGPHEGARGQRALVSYDTMHKLRLYRVDDDTRYFMLKRRVPFSREEKELVEAIAKRMNDCFVAHGKEELLKSVPAVLEEVIAELVAPECPELLLKIIQLYRGWLNDNPPPYHCGHNMGICLKRRATQKNDLMQDDNLKRLGKFGTSPDTLIVLDSEGSICGIDNFPAKNSAAARHEIFAPLAVAGLAAWTGAGQRVALRLTPQGEILIFKKRSLLFARRATGWRCMPHSLILDDFTPDDMDAEERKARRASYFTAMDLAFGRHRACLLLVPENNPLPEVMKAPTGILQDCVEGKNFFALDRGLRADLCVMDGLLLLDKKGRVLGNIPAFDNAEPALLEEFLNKSIGVHVRDDGGIDIYKGGAKPFSIG